MPRPNPDIPSVTALLDRVRGGDSDAEARLLEVVYSDLKQVAGRLMKRERAGHTFQTTDLVHEAWMRLGDAAANAENRAHFVGIAARAMRQVLVDYARRKAAAKRDGGREVQMITGVDAALSVDVAELVALDDALDRLAQRNPRLTRVVELRFFGGLSENETAELLKVTPRTVQRDWVTARAWLHKAIGEGAS